MIYTHINVQYSNPINRRDILIEESHQYENHASTIEESTQYTDHINLRVISIFESYHQYDHQSNL